MKIVADDKIPFLKGVFESCGVEMLYKKGVSVTREDLIDADALIVRTRTECCRELLQHTPVKVVATATIGTDHVNIAELEELGISFFSAPGCNAMSVQQYIVAALLVLGEKYHFALAGKTIGIIGGGQVGSRVAKACENMGMKVLLNDPPRAAAEGDEKFISLAELLAKSDFVTVHVPLDDETFHMADEKFFAMMKKSAFFINSSRGSVCDNKALKYALQNSRIGGAVLDVWENEPDIDTELQNMLEIGTMHIAGYSADGKANGTAQSVRNIARVLHIDELKDFTVPQLKPVSEHMLDIGQLKGQSALAFAVKATYDIMRDSNDLRCCPSDFEKLRNEYYYRREFNGLTLDMSQLDAETVMLLENMNFKKGEHHA